MRNMRRLLLVEPSVATLHSSSQGPLISPLACMGLSGGDCVFMMHCREPATPILSSLQL